MVITREAAHDASMDTTMNDPNPPSGSSHSSASHPLTRSRNDRMIAGVLGGIARKYDFDPAIVRVVFVGMTVLSFGAALLGYVVAWLVVPEADADEPVLTNAVHGARRRPIDRRLWIGLALLFFGAEALADQYGYRVGRFSHVFWPMALIAVGASFLILRERPDQDERPPTPPPGPPRGGMVPVVSPVPAPPSRPERVAGPDAAGDQSASGVADPSDRSDASDASERFGARAGDTAAHAVTAELPPVVASPPSAYPPSRPWPVAEPRHPRRPRRPRRERRERSMLGRLTWSALLIVAGAAWMLDVIGAVDVDGRFVVAVELAIVGAGLLVGAWIGRGRGLIALGLVLTVVAGTFAILDVPLSGPIGERVIRPNRVDALRNHYQVGIGHLELDLRAAQPATKVRRVKLTDVIGYLEVRVPADARVEVNARADSGSIEIFDRPDLGGTHVHRTVIDDPVAATGPRIVIDAHVGFGAIRVERQIQEGTPS